VRRREDGLLGRPPTESGNLPQHAHAQAARIGPGGQRGGRRREIGEWNVGDRRAPVIEIRVLGLELGSNRREDFVYEIVLDISAALPWQTHQEHVAALVTGSLQELGLDDTCRVDRVDFRRVDADRAVAHGVRDAVAKPGKESLPGVIAEKSLDVSEAGHFEQFGLPHDHLAGCQLQSGACGHTGVNWPSADPDS
jgi:hypothetical protein